MDYDSFNINYNDCLNSNEKNFIEEYLIQFIKNYQLFRRVSRSHNFLLNVNDIKNGMEINIIEKFIFDNALQVIDQYNIKHNTSFSIDDFYIEFWANTCDTHRGFHFDIDEMAYEMQLTDCNPCLFSSVLYLSDMNRAPLLISDIERPKIDKDGLFYDLQNEISINTNKNDEIILYFPRKYKQVVFNGAKYFHGLIQFEEYSNNDRYIFGNSFYLKKQKPLYLSYFSHYSYMLWIIINEQNNYNQPYHLDNNPSYCGKLLPEDLINFNKKISKIKSLNNISIDNASENQINVIVKNIDLYNIWYDNLIKKNINVSFEFIKPLLYNEIHNNDKEHIFRVNFLKQQL